MFYNTSALANFEVLGIFCVIEVVLIVPARPSQPGLSCLYRPKCRGGIEVETCFKSHDLGLLTLPTHNRIRVPHFTLSAVLAWIWETS
jgi:hypothetical protein